MQNILIAGAHYDDAELGCGGTAAKFADEGKNVYKLTLTNNETDFKHMNIRVEYGKSMRESAQACEILGVHEISDFTPVKCSQLFYNTEIMQKLEDILYKYNIDTVFMHYEHDLNQDHVSASKICLTAARHCKNIFMYQSNIYITPVQFAPNFFVDISGYIDKKREALNQYTGDHNRFNSLFETGIERNSVWGYANKCKYAEGFVSLKFLI